MKITSLLPLAFSIAAVASVVTAGVKIRLYRLKAKSL